MFGSLIVRDYLLGLRVKVFGLGVQGTRFRCLEWIADHYAKSSWSSRAGFPGSRGRRGRLDTSDGVAAWLHCKPGP